MGISVGSHSYIVWEREPKQLARVSVLGVMESKVQFHAISPNGLTPVGPASPRRKRAQ